MSKYNAIPTHVDGLRFASKREAKRYNELKLMQQGGEIVALEIQPKFPLIVNAQKLGSYIGDFRYRDTATGDLIVEDVKGVRTDVYRLKKKLIKALYGVEIVEV